jgi:hypothetical protein
MRSTAHPSKPAQIAFFNPHGEMPSQHEVACDEPRTMASIETTISVSVPLRRHLDHGDLTTTPTDEVFVELTCSRPSPVIDTVSDPKPGMPPKSS